MKYLLYVAVAPTLNNMSVGY